MHSGICDDSLVAARRVDDHKVTVPAAKRLIEGCIIVIIIEYSIGIYPRILVLLEDLDVGQQQGRLRCTCT